MGHITADDAKWLVSIAIFAVLVWSVAFLVYVQPGNPRGARQRKADRQAAWRAKGYGKQKRALSPLAFVAMVFPSLIVITWYALPPHVRRQALEGVNFGAATNNAIGIGREVRALVRRAPIVGEKIIGARDAWRSFQAAIRRSASSSTWASVARRVAASFSAASRR